MTLGAVARAIGLDLPARADAERKIATVAPAHLPVADALVFIDRPNGMDLAALDVCAAILCTETVASTLPAGPALLVADEPRHAFLDAVSALFPDSLGDSPVIADPAAARTVGAAMMASSARLEPDVTVEPGAVIGDDVEIGRGTVVGANAVIARGCRIGRDCRIGPGVAIQYALIGDRVGILPGARIGQEGFGFMPRPDGLRRVPQLGRVIVQDDAEIGANTTIDRGALEDTVIGQGTKIDNLVQVAHNVRIGVHTAIAGQVGISGSVTIGDRCMIGGGAGFADHVTIGNDVSVGAGSGVMNDIGDGERWAGVPAQPSRAFFRQQAALRRLADPSKRQDRN
ncbi:MULTISPECIES: UDP-3-O-(3-hydroxymyristoyl)glucosamine N-acyltransferase [unclassified Roseitalea]|uniref:UDP-3-O-(3-hydroxymyristoyl)glucosamine N-acyltransferase n=1 Tax=unclassified Roseitalea TaxID=2639107 RepID=UPI00273D66EE|nr:MULTISPECIES: UDP-3-O-(3-hydroxymyristoyl)glucosamine N-acyltransferase [unclassified Roseitalea]